MRWLACATPFNGGRSKVCCLATSPRLKTRFLHVKRPALAGGRRATGPVRPGLRLAPWPSCALGLPAAALAPGLLRGLRAVWIELVCHQETLAPFSQRQSIHVFPCRQIG